MVPEKVYQLKEYTATQANSIGGKHARFCFCISKPGKAPIYFRAGSREQTIQWVSLLMVLKSLTYNVSFASRGTHREPTWRPWCRPSPRSRTWRSTRISSLRHR